ISSSLTLPPMQLLHRIGARADAVMQFRHRDSTDALFVGERGNSLCRRIDKDRSVEERFAPGHLVRASFQGSVASNSAAGTSRRVRRCRWPSRWWGTKSATGWPCTVTVKDSPAATRRMISALLLRSSDYLIAIAPCGSSGGVGERAVDPGHQSPQPRADLLDGVALSLCAQLGEVRPAVVVLGNPLLGEATVLDLGEDPAHLVFDLRRDDPRSTGEVAVLGGVGDRVTHPGDTALVHQIDDQLDLVQAFEIRDL